MTVARSPWLLRKPRARPAQLRVFCFSHAGAGASSYAAWGREAPADVDWVALQFPGRENRFNEPCFRNLGELVEALLRELEAELKDVPYALFGHSMGALIAFETARAIANRQMAAPPVALFVSGRPAPDAAQRMPPYHLLPDDALLAALAPIAGPMRSFAADPSLILGVLPVIRADLALVDDYRYVAGPLLTSPLWVFGAKDDPLTPVRTLESWSAMTRADCEFRL
ncbi:MAG TPA: alpha/beta fold hydrolase, partial [Polyangiaceae bacterium]